NVTTVCEGTNVSATVTAGTGGDGCTDTYQYSNDGGTSWHSYTPGDPISTTAGNTVTVQTQRGGCTAGSGCTATGWVTIATWNVNTQPPAPPLLVKSPNITTVCEGTNVSATVTAGTGGDGCTDTYQYSNDGG